MGGGIILTRKNCRWILFIVLCLLFMFETPILASTTIDFTLQRYNGNDRYETAANIAQSYWTAAQYAIVTTGENFPDALCAAPLAKKLDAPILLTGKTSLNAHTKQALTSLGVRNVYIIGGTGVISDSVENELSSMNIHHIRVSGRDRYETSTKIAEMLDSDGKAFFTSGEDFSDAVSVSPIAAAQGIPIILVPKNNLPANTLNYIKDKKVNQAYIIGGSDMIGDGVVKQLPGIVRITGDKYLRNLAITYYFADSINFSTVFVATGENFPDALSGSVVAARTSSPIIITGKTPNQDQRNYVSHQMPLVKKIIVLGGKGAVPSYTVQNLISTDPLIEPIKIVGREGGHENLSQEEINLRQNYEKATNNNLTQSIELGREAKRYPSYFMAAEVKSRGENYVILWGQCYPNNTLVPIGYDSSNPFDSSGNAWLLNNSNIKILTSNPEGIGDSFGQFINTSGDLYYKAQEWGYSAIGLKEPIYVFGGPPNEILQIDEKLKSLSEEVEISKQKLIDYVYHTCTSMINSKPNDSETYRICGDMLYSLFQFVNYRNAYDDAENYYLAAVEKDSNNALAYLMLGNMRNTDEERLIEYLNKAASINPDLMISYVLGLEAYSYDKDIMSSVYNAAVSALTNQNARDKIRYLAETNK